MTSPRDWDGRGGGGLIPPYRDTQQIHLASLILLLGILFPMKHSMFSLKRTSHQCPGTVPFFLRHWRLETGALFVLFSLWADMISFDTGHTPAAHPHNYTTGLLARKCRNISKLTPVSVAIQQRKYQHRFKSLHATQLTL